MKLEIQFSLNIFLGFEGILGSASRVEFPITRSSHVGLTPRLLYSSTHHSQKVLPIGKLVELKMLDFSDCTRTGISILTSATGSAYIITKE